MIKKRDQFTGKWGFIVACIGSSVGMGNIWLFPSRVSGYGGAAFLLPYFLCVIIIGYTGVVGEMAFGRAMEAGPLAAFGKATERAGKGRVMSPMDAHSQQKPVPVHVTLEGYGTMLEADGSVGQGRNETTITIAVPEAKLWWPIGYGDQPLYAVSVTAGADLQAAWSGRIGFRTTHVDTRADEVGRPFQIYVNDVPVHAHGYNWIPDDAFISRISKRDYERGIRDLVEANANMVRIWGGGIYEDDVFYDLCDEHGIMVWHDFMLACAAYPEDAETKEEVEAEAREQIIRLSPHPSLIVWNGSNENYVAYAEWGGYKQALRDDDRKPNDYGYGEKPWGDYYYSELFPQLLADLDPTHVYLPSSPMSFTRFTNANWDTDGTMHIWDAWNRADYTVYADYTPRFADEFGYQAPPAWSTLAGDVLATQRIDDVTIGAPGHRGFPLDESVATFGDPANELIVATPSDDAFPRVILNGAEIIDQRLAAPADAFSATAGRTVDGMELTVTARGYVRDLFCMVDKVDPAARVDEGMVSLLPGETVTLHITTSHTGDPADFAEANVLRTANDLKR